MIIAITGLTGFLGYFLAKRLYEMDDIKIKALVRRNSDLRFVKGFQEKISFIKGDLSNRRSLAELAAGVDVVVHAAYYSQEGAFTGGGLSDKRKYLEVNLIGSHDLLEQANAAGVKQFIFISSCAVFSAIDPELPLNEKHSLMPHSLYGAYKASVESMCHAYFLSEGLETVIFRPVSIYGKHPKTEKCNWYGLVKDVKDGKDVEVSGGGKIVHVEEVVQAIILALGNRDIAGNAYALVDIFIDKMEIAKISKEIFGSKSRISGTRKIQKNMMLNERAKELGVKFRGKDGLRDYIKDL